MILLNDSYLNDISWHLKTTKQLDNSGVYCTMGNWGPIAWLIKIGQYLTIVNKWEVPQNMVAAVKGTTTITGSFHKELDGG